MRSLSASRQRPLRSTYALAWWLILAGCTPSSDADGELAESAVSNIADGNDAPPENTPQTNALSWVYEGVTYTSSSTPASFNSDLARHLDMVNAQAVWMIETGEDMQFVIWDTPLYVENPDLDVNNTFGSLAGTFSSSTHGNQVASIVAGVNDGEGALGLAFNAEVNGIDYRSSANWSRIDGTEIEQIAHLKSLDAANASWRNSQDFSHPSDLVTGFLPDLGALGRDGYGAILTLSAGNYGSSDNSNTASPQNRFDVIVAGAVEADRVPSSFSSSGANVLLTAQGSAVFTSNAAEVESVPVVSVSTANGTSFSSPLISAMTGIIGEIAPTIGARDIVDILVLSAEPAEEKANFELPSLLYDRENHWDAIPITNAGHNWNNGGQQYTYLTGFGVPDLETAVGIAQGWRFFHDTHRVFHSIDAADLAVDSSLPTDGEVISTTQAEFHDDTTNLWIRPTERYTTTFTFSDALEIDSIVVTADLLFENLDAQGGVVTDRNAARQVDLVLYSPQGTRIDVFQHHNAARSITFGDIAEIDDWEFIARGFRNENMKGEWRLVVENNYADGKNYGFAIRDLELRAYGDSIDKPDYIVVTEDFAELVASDPSRAVFRDHDGGSLAAGDRDIISFAALEDGVEVYLDPNAVETSRAAGVELTIEGGIDDLSGGSGDDILVGNEGANRLWGGNGADVLRGAGGDDSLNGFTGNDTLYGGDGADMLVGGAGHDTIDPGTGADIIGYDSGLDRVVLAADTGALTIQLPSFIDPAVFDLYQVDAMHLVLDFGDSNQLLLQNYVDLYAGVVGNDLAWQHALDSGLTAVSVDLTSPIISDVTEADTPTPEVDNDFSPW